jgi:thiol reductant ABC exporter CydC subunit
MDFQLGDLLARIVSDVETLENFYVRVLAPPLAAVVIAGAVSVFLARWDARLVLILLASYLLLGFLFPLWMGHLSQGPGIDLIAQRSRLHARLVDSIQGLADLLAFGRGPAKLEDIAGVGRAYGQAERRMAWLGGLEVGLVVLVSNVALWSVLLVCIPRVGAGSLHGTMLASLALLVMASFEAVMPLPTAARMWTASREAARRLFEVVDAYPAVVDRRGSQGESLLPARAGLPSLEVRDVSYTYPGRTQPALDGVSFTLEPRRSLAIVGPSGAGKSTLAWLLLRFWDYGSGEILLGGRSIRDYTQEALRSQIGFLSPHDHIFNTTLRENLRMARRGLSSAEIEAAAARAQLHDAVLRMPGGYETLVGERGARLSGGERQRMTIARVLLKDAPLLLLDEPTANLDPLTEEAVLGTLFELIRSRTALLITHRLVGLEHVDGILVMNHGRIVERGTHASLLREDGLYRRLWDLQNRRLAEAPPFGP